MLEHTVSIGHMEGSHKRARAGEAVDDERWFAACSCGWQGPYRTKQDHALADVRSHSAIKNPRPAAAS